MFRDFAETDEEYRAWKAAITRTHMRRVTVRVMNIEHKRLAWIDQVIDGQVTIDVDNRECTRVANLTLVDRHRAIGWEPDTPSSLPIHLRRMIQINDERYVPGYGWVSCPVFTGPTVDVDRDGAEVSVVAEGKDRLALSSFGRTLNWKKKRRLTEVIRDMIEHTGEAPSRIHLPQTNETIGSDINVTRVDQPFARARKLAKAHGYVVFYDARGHFRMRKVPDKHAFELGTDWLLAPARLDRPELEIKNRWIILGPKPQGNKKRVQADVWLPGPHPFSAWSLGRGGKPRWLIHHEERSGLKTDAKAREIAERMRAEKVRHAAEIAVDCLPLPNIEEYDLMRVKDPLTGPSMVRVKQATIPLVEGAQTIGAVRRVARVKRGGGYHPPTQGGL